MLAYTRHELLSHDIACATGRNAMLPRALLKVIKNAGISAFTRGFRAGAGFIEPTKSHTACCMESTPFAVVHTLDERIHNRVAGRKTGQVDLTLESEFLFLAHHLQQEFDMDDVHRRLVVLSVHQARELFQLFQHVNLDGSSPELYARLLKLWVLLQLFQVTDISLRDHLCSPLQPVAQ